MKKLVTTKGCTPMRTTENPFAHTSKIIVIDTTIV